MTINWKQAEKYIEDIFEWKITQENKKKLRESLDKI